MLEIEIKSRVVDASKLEAKLLAKGARDFGFAYQQDVYYSHPARDFAVTDEALRIRVSNDLQVVTYKGPKVDTTTKSREELEVSISSSKVMSEILENLGFRSVLTVKKRRRTFGVDGVEVCIDTVEGLGDFVEFEVDDEDLEAGRRRISELMLELGVSGSERRSYLELLLEKSRARDR